MKKLFLFSNLFVCAFTFAQYSTINSTSTPGLGIGVPPGPNFSDAAVHIIAADNNQYAYGGGQQLLFGETTAPSAQGDYFRIMNGSGTNSLFAPLVSGFGNSHNTTSLSFLALASSAKDNGTNPLMTFRAGLDFTPITSQESANAGANVVNRPLFQWMNWETPKMTMDATGKLGLGTTTPTSTLHSVGTARLESLPASTTNTNVITTDANGNLAMQAASSLFTSTGWNLNGNAATATDFIGTTNAQALNFKTNSVDRATIKATGEFGIGTNTPTAALHLLTGTNSGMLPPKFVLERNDGTNQAGVLTVGVSSNGFATALLGGGSAYFKLEDPFGNSQNSDIGFSTNANAAQLVIKHSGNVGIGTETPAQKLHVKDGALLLSGSVAGFGGPQLLFSDNETTHPNGRWAIEYLSATPTQPSMGGLNFWTPFNPIGPNGTAGNYSLFLKDDGKIGMGVTDETGDVNFCASALPNGYRLFVNGGVLTTKVKVANYCSTAWADYVFANDYNLKPLSEVESFIKENKHLPNIPSATELEKEGLDLGEMQSLQMAKIEELTLYMIEMKKEIESLKKQNSILSSQISKN